MVSVTAVQATVLIVAPYCCQCMDAQHRATISHYHLRCHHQDRIFPLSYAFGSVNLAEISSGLTKDIKE